MKHSQNVLQNSHSEDQVYTTSAGADTLSHPRTRKDQRERCSQGLSLCKSGREWLRHLWCYSWSSVFGTGLLSQFPRNPTVYSGD